MQGYCITTIGVAILFEIILLCVTDVQWAYVNDYLDNVKNWDPQLIVVDGAMCA